MNNYFKQKWYLNYFETFTNFMKALVWFWLKHKQGYPKLVKTITKLKVNVLDNLIQKLRLEKNEIRMDYWTKEITIQSSYIAKFVVYHLHLSVIENIFKL